MLPRTCGAATVFRHAQGGCHFPGRVWGPPPCSPPGASTSRWQARASGWPPTHSPVSDWAPLPGPGSCGLRHPVFQARRLCLVLLGPCSGEAGEGGAAGRVGRGGETGPLAGREGMERRWPGGGQRQRQRRQRPTVTGRGLGQLWLRQGWLQVRCRLVGPWWAGACVVPGTGVPLAQQPWGWPWSPCGGVACSAGSGLLSASESPLGGELRPGGHLRGPQPRESSCVLALPCAQESVIEKPPRPGAG